MRCPLPTGIRPRSRFFVESQLAKRATCRRAHWSGWRTNCSAIWTRKKPAMPRVDRGSVWIVDLGMVAKVRPCLILSVPTDPQDRVLVSLVPHTTSIQGTRFEVAVQAKFLHAGGVFDAQQVVTVPQVKL